ncbi:MAG: shikimate kinase [Thermodesulfobacteriota bacterium]|nr:shikimate kinase [Thermodesulfobacteriota bacterium]
MNIVLIGYRGTGKSLVGGLLAARLDMHCISVDAEIIKKASMSIPDIVETYGWPKFRDLESEVIQELAGHDRIIIDAGGGIIERPENISALSTNFRIFWLKASVNVIVSRIHKDTERPALIAGKTFTEEVAEVLERRIPKYRHAAHYEIDTDELTPENVTDRIIKLWAEAQRGCS